MAARRWLAALLTGALVTPLLYVASLGADDHGTPAAHAATDYGGSGEFHPVDERGLVNTTKAATNGNQVTGARRFNTTMTVRVAGAAPIGGGPAPVPATGVQSVLLNVTAIYATTAGWVGAYPTGRASPNQALVQATPGRVNTNAVLVQPGAGGQVNFPIVAPVAGTVHVYVDVVGWFGTTSAPRGSRLVPVTAGRVLDTRAGYGAPKQVVGQGGQVNLRVWGMDAVNPSRPDIVPNSPNVTAVALSLTTVSPNTNTFLTIGRPGGPNVAYISRFAGSVATSMVVVPVAADGTIRITNGRGKIQLVADVVGYFVKGAASTTRAGRVMPLSVPFLAIDTRAPPAVGRLSARTLETWDFTPFVNSVRSGSAAAGREQGLFVHLSVLNLAFPYGASTGSSNFAVNSGGVGYLGTASLTYTTGDVGRVTAIVRFGAGNRVTFYNGGGFADYIVDVLGVVLAD